MEKSSQQFSLCHGLLASISHSQREHLSDATFNSFLYECGASWTGRVWQSERVHHLNCGCTATYLRMKNILFVS